MNLAFILRKYRSRGYTLEQSLAELADNSITHNAKNISLNKILKEVSKKNYINKKPKLIRIDEN